MYILFELKADRPTNCADRREIFHCSFSASLTIHIEGAHGQLPQPVDNGRLLLVQRTVDKAHSGQLRARSSMYDTESTNSHFSPSKKNSTRQHEHGAQLGAHENVHQGVVQNTDNVHNQHSTLPNL